MKEQHVIFPKTPNTSSIVEKAREEENTWKQVEGMFGRPQWFLQPVVAQLLYVGEVRCFIVGGWIFYKVTTTPGDGQLDTPCQITNHEPIRPLGSHR